MVVIEIDAKGGEIATVFRGDALDQLLGADPFVLRAQHDRRAVRVVSADVVTLVATHFLKTHPDIGLDVLNQMADVDGTVGVR